VRATTSPFSTVRLRTGLQCMEDSLLNALHDGGLPSYGDAPSYPHMKHEHVETTQIYLHADLRLKERALGRTLPPRNKSGRFRPSDFLLAFLENLLLGATRFDRPATPKMTAKSCQSWHRSAGVTRPSTRARGVTAVAGVEARGSVCG
jgi:hypothetical protein